MTDGLWVNELSNNSQASNMAAGNGGWLDGVFVSKEIYSTREEFDKKIRPVLTLDAKKFLIKGTGTRKDPYILTLKKKTN